MSMLRCLYGRLKLIKSTRGELNTTTNIICDSHEDRFCTPYLVNLAHTHHRSHHLNSMTFNENNLNEKSTRDNSSSSSPSTGSSSVPVKDTNETQNDNVDFYVQNNGTSFLWNSTTNRATSSITEGHYYNHSYRSSHHSENTHGEYRDQARKNKCEFNFDSINVRLLETFGFIGTAVAVGIDVRSRINEWMPSRNRHQDGLQYFCHYHHHHHNPIGPSTLPGGLVTTPTSPLTLSRALETFHRFPSPTTDSSITSSTSSTHCCFESGDLFLATIRYCASCILCRGIFDSLYHLYTNALPNFSSALNILPRKSNLIQNVANSNKDKRNNENDSGTDCTSLDNEHDGLIQSASTNRKDVYQVDFSSAFQRKISIKKNDQSTHKSESSTKSDSVILSSDSSAQSSVKLNLPDSESKNPSSSGVVNESKLVEEDSDDIAAVFRMASIEYSNQLNNVVAIALMNCHQPDKAMECWSSCQASSSAFFNMGVAYESGRHVKNGQPDLDRAHDCYALAASMGHTTAIYNLALFYLYGKGKIQPDLTRGLELLELAAAKGMEVASSFFVELRHRERIEKIRKFFLNKKETDNVKNNNTVQLEQPWQSSSIHLDAKRRKHSVVHQESDLSYKLKRNLSAPDLLVLSTK